MVTSRRINEDRTAFARSLRTEMTDAERVLWRTIRGKQIEGCKFRRQHPVGPYIVDFACIEKKLAIELDGGQHQDRLSYDERRTSFLQMHGWRVVRFWNNDVLENLDGVLAVVVEVLGIQPPSQPSPCQGEGVFSGTD